MDRTPIIIAGALILLFVAVVSLASKLKKPKREGAKPPAPSTSAVKTRTRVPFGDPDYVKKLRENSTASFDETKERAVSIGCTHYIWRSCEDEAVCVVCSTNNGRKFRWDYPHHHGHPGSGCRSHDGHCRCYAEPVIPS